MARFTEIMMIAKSAPNRYRCIIINKPMTIGVVVEVACAYSCILAGSATLGVSYFYPFPVLSSYCQEKTANHFRLYKHFCPLCSQSLFGKLCWECHKTPLVFFKLWYYAGCDYIELHGSCVMMITNFVMSPMNERWYFHSSLQLQAHRFSRGMSTSISLKKLQHTKGKM